MSESDAIHPPLSQTEQALAARLRQHVERLAGLIGPRHMGKPSTIEATLAYIAREFEAMGDEVGRQAYHIGEQEAVNLIIERPAREGSKRRDEIVVVGAHYDTVPETPGADDNASAVAMLIEVARLLHGLATKRALRFVAFANEEPPHFHTGTMGSQVYARACRADGEQITAMLCLEMVGYYRTERGSQQIPPAIPRLLRWAFPKRGDFLAAVGNIRSWRLLWPFRRGFKQAARFPLFTISLPELVHEIRLSDNSSFWGHGYRALMLTDTSFLRNPHYHQPSDTPDTLDYERTARATLGVAGGAARLAGARGKVELFSRLGE